MQFLKWLKGINPFKKKIKSPKVTDKDRESFAKIILDKKNNKKENQNKKKYKPINTYIIEGIEFKVGDKVICRSNEPHPLLVGKIIEFWDNNGKWGRAVPRVKDTRNGRVWNANGVVKPYSEDLMSSLRHLKPLEQWNFLVPEEARYTEAEIKKKVFNYYRRKEKGNFAKK